MSTSYFSRGFQAARQRPGLITIIYTGNLILSLAVVIPLTLALTAAVADTGHGGDMAREFDLTLWADVLGDLGPALSSFFGLFLRAIPFLLLWKVASSVGLIHALGMGGGRSFWQGVGRYTGKGLLVALFYLLGVIVVFVGVFVASLLLNLIIVGEAGIFWVSWVISPIMLIGGLAKVDLMHDFARIELVLGHKGSVDAALAGIKWPFRSRAAWGIYAAWFVVSLVLLAIPTWLDLAVVGFWSIFLAQQLFLFGRAGVTVAWVASEIHLFEDIQSREAPLIADADEAGPADGPTQADEAGIGADSEPGFRV